MRSIIFASFMMVATMVVADEPVLGCYERIYDEGDLARNPTQIIEKMRLEIYQKPDFDGVLGFMQVRFADHGRLKGSENAGAVASISLSCFTSGDGQMRCGPSDCDSAGSLIVTAADREELHFYTSGMHLDDPEAEWWCTHVENILPILGEPAAFRLYRVPDLICEQH